MPESAEFGSGKVDIIAEINTSDELKQIGPERTVSIVQNFFNALTDSTDTHEEALAKALLEATKESLFGSIIDTKNNTIIYNDVLNSFKASFGEKLYEEKKGQFEDSARAISGEIDQNRNAIHDVLQETQKDLNTVRLFQGELQEEVADLDALKKQKEFYKARLPVSKDELSKVKTSRDQLEDEIFRLENAVNSDLPVQDANQAKLAEKELKAKEQEFEQLESRIEKLEDFIKEADYQIGDAENPNSEGNLDKKIEEKNKKISKLSDQVAKELGIDSNALREHLFNDRQEAVELVKIDAKNQLNKLKKEVITFLVDSNKLIIQGGENLKGKLAYASELPENTDEEKEQKKEIYLRIEKERIQKDPNLNQSEKQQALRSLEVLGTIDPEVGNKINKLKEEMVSQNVTTPEYANNKHIKKAMELLNDNSPKGLVYSQQLLNISEKRCKFAFAEDFNKNQDYIIYQAINNLMSEKIKKSNIDKESSEFKQEYRTAKEVRSQVISAKDKLFQKNNNVHPEIHDAITTKYLELLATGSGLDVQMKAVVSYLNGGPLTPEAMAVINNSRDQSARKSLIEQFSKTKDEKDIPDKTLDKLDSSGQIFLAACSELCEEARIRMAHDMGFFEYGKQGKLEINESEMGNWLEDKFGKAQGIAKYDEQAQLYKYNHEYVGTVSSRINFKNFFVYEIGFHFGVLTAAFNIMAAFRTGNWDNEYIYAGLAATYASYKEVKGDYIERAMHPEKIPFILAGQVNKNEATCFADENELKLAKMIDWSRLRKNRRRAEDLMGDNKPGRWMETFSNLSESDKPKKSKDSSPGQITLNELDELVKTDSLPLINPSDQGKIDFKMVIDSLPNNHDSHRWEFFDFILKESWFDSSDKIDAVAFNVQQIVDERNIKL